MLADFRQQVIAIGDLILHRRLSHRHSMGYIELLLCSQRNHGVDTHGSTRWEKTRGQRDKEQQSQHREKCKRIGGRHAEEQTAHHTCQPKRPDESNDDAHKSQPHSLLEDQGEDACAARAGAMRMAMSAVPCVTRNDITP